MPHYSLFIVTLSGQSLMTKWSGAVYTLEIA